MKVFIIKIKELILKLLLIFLISLAFFYAVPVLYKLYAVVAICVCLFTIIGYRRKSKTIYREIVVLLSSNGVAYVLAKCLHHSTFTIDSCNITLTILYVAFALVIFSAVFAKKAKRSGNSIDLYPQRVRDLDRIKEYLDKFNAIGINGVWGSGKTVLINQLIKDAATSNKYEFIVIDLLSCNLDEIQSTLLDELQKALTRNRIFSRHSSQLKKILGEISFLEGLQDFIFPNSASYKATLDGFNDDIVALGKTIVIIYEDIDRITDKDIIRKIFSISEHLYSGKIKVIYQYDQNNLDELGLDRRFSEKYIPFIVNLTEIDLITAIEFGLKELCIDSSILCNKDFSFLHIPISIDNRLRRVFDLTGNLEIKSYGIGVRRVNQFLVELLECLQTNSKCNDKLGKRTTIIFFYIKHFLYDIYNQINVAESLIDTLKFKYQDGLYTIMQVLSMYQQENKLTKAQIKELFENPENGNVLLVLHLLEYKFNFDEAQNTHDIEKRFESILDKSTQFLSDEHDNENIDRVMWNLWANGKSKYTNYEKAVSQLMPILNMPVAEQENAFTTYWNRTWHGEDESGKQSDNGTIFRFGVPLFIEIFRAFRIVGASPATWMKLVDFYFRERKVDEVTPELIATLRYCYLANEQVYIHVIKKFNALTIIGNMNNQKPYASFLMNYFDVLPRIGYSNGMYGMGLGINKDSDVLSEKDFILSVFEGYKRALENLRDGIPLTTVQENIQTIIAFIEKNEEIINSPVMLNKPGLKITTTMSSRLPHQEEVDRLSLLKLERERFLQEVEKSYTEGEITVHEVSELLKDK